MPSGIEDVQSDVSLQELMEAPALDLSGAVVPDRVPGDLRFGVGLCVVRKALRLLWG